MPQAVNLHRAKEPAVNTGRVSDGVHFDHANCNVAKRHGSKDPGKPHGPSHGAPLARPARRPPVDESKVKLLPSRLPYFDR